MSNEGKSSEAAMRNYNTTLCRFTLLVAFFAIIHIPIFRCVTFFETLVC